MNGKFIGVVIGAVVAVMLVGSLLIPVLDNATSGGGTTIIEGSPTTYAYIEGTPDFNDMIISISGDKVNITQSGITKSYDKTVIDKIPLIIVQGVYDFEPEDNIRKLTVYYDSGSSALVFFDYLNNNIWPINGSITIKDTSSNGGIFEMDYINGDNEEIYLGFGSIEWLVIPDSNSSYELFSQSYPGSESAIIKTIPFRGTTVWILAPPAVIDNGPDYSTLYYTIPIILLIALLVAFATVAFKRQY